MSFAEHGPMIQSSVVCCLLRDLSRLQADCDPVILVREVDVAAKGCPDRSENVLIEVPVGA